MMKQTTKHTSGLTWKGAIWLLVCTAAWSTSGLFVHQVLKLGGFTPVSLAFWRDTVTGVVLMGWLVLFRRDLLKVNRRDLVWLALMGAFGIGFFHVLWNTSVIMNGVSIATILQYNSPIFVALAAALFFRERLTLPKLAAIGLTFAGTVLVAGVGIWQSGRDGASGASFTLVGALIGLSSAAVHSTFTMLGKKLSASHPVAVLGYAFCFGGLALLPFQIGQTAPDFLAKGVVMSFTALILVTTILGFTAYIAALRLMEASIAAIGSTIEVPIATVLSYLLLGERILLVQGWGALLIIAGVVVVSLVGRKQGLPIEPIEKELNAGL